jgi:hypothetical protein
VVTARERISYTSMNFSPAAGCSPTPPASDTSPDERSDSLCGWQCRGTEEEVIAQVQAHRLEVHGVAATREEILALAVEIPA